MPALLRRLLQPLLRALPRSTREALLRRLATFPDSSLEDVSIRVATSASHHLGAFRVVHDAYVERGYIKPQPTGLWVTEHHVMPEATVFVMERRGECIGSLSLTEDSAIGLPCSATFPEVAALRRPGVHLAEVGTLALAPAWRNSGLFLCLIVAMWRYARYRLEVSDLVIVVSAATASYYEALAGYRSLGPVRSYEGFPRSSRARGDDPVAGLHLHLAAAPGFVCTHWRRPPRGRFNLRSLVEMPCPAWLESLPPAALGHEQLMRYKLSREVFRELFLHHTQLIRALPPRTREHLMRHRTRATTDVNGADPEPGCRVPAPDPGRESPPLIACPSASTHERSDP